MLLNPQHKLKSTTKSKTGSTLWQVSNLIDNTTDETNFLHKSILTDRQGSKLLQFLQLILLLIQSYWKQKFLI